MIKNRLTFLFLLILSIIFLYNFGGFVPSLFFNTLLSLLLFSIAYTVYIYFRLRFTQEIDKEVIVKGEKIRLTIRLTNRDLLIYPYIYVTFFGSHSVFKAYSFSQSLSINPLSRKEYVFELECKFRGQYEIGISELYIEDFLGLIRLKFRIPKKKKIIVYPKIESLSDFNLINNDSSDSQSLSQSSIEDTTSIKDLREYNYGDSLKKVHWKLSARNNKLMIKNYQSTSDVNVDIILDLRKDTFSEDNNLILEDKLIEAVIAVMYYYLPKRVQINYVFFNKNKLESLKVSNQAEFDFIYNNLATVNFDQTIPLADIVRLHSDSSSKTTDAVIFTSILDIDLYNQIFKAHTENQSVCLIYVSPENLNTEKPDMAAETSEITEILKNLPEIGVSVYTINPDDDIKKILGGVCYAANK